MSKNWRMIAAAAVAAAVIVSAPSVSVFTERAKAAAYSNIYEVHVQSGYLALRTAKAYDSSNEIGSLYTGDFVQVLDTSDSQYWWVYAPGLGQSGYVNKDYLILQTTGYSSQVMTVQVENGYLALRTSRAYDPSNEIGRLYSGDMVEVLSADYPDYWYVYAPSLNAAGYVNCDYLYDGSDWYDYRDAAKDVDADDYDAGMWEYEPEDSQQNEAPEPYAPYENDPDGDTADAGAADLSTGNVSELFEKFLDNEIPAHYNPDLIPYGAASDEVYFQDLLNNSSFPYNGERYADMDNDGEDELIISWEAAPRHVMYLDAADGQVNIFVDNAGTFWSFYSYFQGAVWIGTADTTHAYRQVYTLCRYEGMDNLVDQTELSAWYQGQTYDASSDFQFRGESISMDEFESLVDELNSGMGD